MLGKIPKESRIFSMRAYLSQAAHAPLLLRQDGHLTRRTELGIAFHDPPVLRAPRHDHPVAQHAEGEHGPVVHCPDCPSDGVVAATPDQNVAAAVACDEVSGGGEGEAGEVPGRGQ